MKYMLLICVDKNIKLSPAEGEAMGSTTERWVAQTGKVRLTGGPLRPADTATTVRVRDGQLLVSDGPFAETKEQIAGYDLLECDSMDDAVAVAARHPVTVIGSVEVREVPGAWLADRLAQGEPAAPGTIRYMLLHCLDESAELDPDLDAGLPGSPAQVTQDAWDEDLEERGIKLSGVRLGPAAQARTVQVRDGQLLVIDGPFAETKEQVAGLNVLECTDLDQAIEIAAGHPTAQFGTFELRPFEDFE
jgi:hypothetical protein